MTQCSVADLNRRNQESGDAPVILLPADQDAVTPSRNFVFTESREECRTPYVVFVPFAVRAVRRSGPAPFEPWARVLQFAPEERFNGGSTGVRISNHISTS